MVRYASGKRAIAHCEICGFRFPLHHLRYQWDGLLVCKKDYSIKHPQLTPRSPSDAQGLKNPRPITDDDGTVTVLLQDIFPGTFVESDFEPTPDPDPIPDDPDPGVGVDNLILDSGDNLLLNDGESVLVLE